VGCGSLSFSSFVVSWQLKTFSLCKRQLHGGIGQWVQPVELWRTPRCPTILTPQSKFWISACLGMCGFHLADANRLERIFYGSGLRFTRFDLEDLRRKGKFLYPISYPNHRSSFKDLKNWVCLLNGTSRSHLGVAFWTTSPA
jgi:hypothetical protein